MRKNILALGAATLIGAAAGAYWIWPAGDGSASQTSAETIAMGRSLYAEHCASCHGAKLEGQPNWRERLPNGRMPAPPHDASGHTWHHPDEVLFRITKEGMEALVGGNYESDMRGFGDLMSDDEIRAVLAFIKSTWPEKQRAHQKEANNK